MGGRPPDDGHGTYDPGSFAEELAAPVPRDLHPPDPYLSFGLHRPGDSWMPQSS